MKTYIMNEINKSIETKKKILESKNIIDEILKVAIRCIDSYKNHKKIITCGNGGSASDALHFIGELVGRYRIERKGINGICLNSNVAVMTAIANDYNYENMFAKEVEAIGIEGDVFFGITTSGNSKIINNAIIKAREMKITTVGLLGRDGGAAKDLCDYSIIVPSNITSNIQESHILIIHILSGLIEKALFGI